MMKEKNLLMKNILFLVKLVQKLVRDLRNYLVKIFLN